MFFLFQKYFLLHTLKGKATSHLTIYVSAYKTAQNYNPTFPSGAYSSAYNAPLSIFPLHNKPVMLFGLKASI